MLSESSFSFASSGCVSALLESFEAASKSTAGNCGGIPLSVELELASVETDFSGNLRKFFYISSALNRSMRRPVRNSHEKEESLLSSGELSNLSPGTLGLEFQLISIEIPGQGRRASRVPLANLFICPWRRSKQRRRGPGIPLTALARFAEMRTG